MWITLLIITLAVAMMLGPIMLMRPTQRQRRLAALRAAAVEQGMRVRMTPMPARSARAGQSITVYYRAWPEGKRRKDTWMLARQSISHGIHFHDDWDWVDHRQALEDWQASLKSALPTLPPSVVGIEATEQMLGLYWLEQTAGQEPAQAIAQVAAWLEAVMPPARL